MNKELILAIDFGGQCSQLIARRVRECGVYCKVHLRALSIDEIKEVNPKEIIFTGEPNSVYGEDSPLCDKTLFEAGIPILGICCDSQLVAHMLRGKVVTAPVNEYKRTKVDANVDSKIFDEILASTICWMSHTDYIERAPEGFKTVANTPICPVAAMECPEEKLYTARFHPEVMHTQEGTRMISNFLYDVCECSGDWKVDSFVEKTIQEVRERVGNGKVLCVLSDGVDSSVAAVLLLRVVGSQLAYVFVDHGLLRKNEGSGVEEVFGPNGQYDLNFTRVNARERFYEKLKGIKESEQRRKIISKEFIRVFEEEAKKMGAVDFLVQGTIYPDVIKNGLGKSTVMKSHHNVGGFPDYVDFKEIIKPLGLSFKDEVRKVGLELGIPEELVYKQPSPGPGLGIHIIGEVTAEKARIVQDADAIYREGTANARVDGELGQYFATLTNIRSVEVMRDERAYDYAVVLRAVTMSDFMTAESADLPQEVLGKIMIRIVSKVRGINRAMYDCAEKPPATIEFG